jgi:archaetidylinositol phosphate synthase
MNAAATTDFKNPVRVHQAITAKAERHLLVWMGERLPSWMNSDHLTAIGFGAQIAAGAAYALARWDARWLVGVCILIVLNWFGDSLDGTVARLRNKQRPRYGFYVDHIVDAFGATALMGGLALSDFLHWQIAGAMLITFLLVSIETFLATYSLGHFHLSHGVFGPTEIRILLIVGNLRLMHSPMVHCFGQEFLLFDFGGVIAALGMFGMAVWSAIKHTAVLYREERV